MDWIWESAVGSETVGFLLHPRPMAVITARSHGSCKGSNPSWFLRVRDPKRAHCTLGFWHLWT